MVKTQTPITYKVKDLEGELVKGTLYSHELQRVEIIASIRSRHLVIFEEGMGFPL